MIVLLVENDEGTRVLLGRQLTDVGYTVREARGPVEAMAHVREQLPKAVVTDWVTGEGGGQRLVELLAVEPGFTAPVVVITALSEQEMPPTGGLVKAVLHKPFDSARLVETLQALGVAP